MTDVEQVVDPRREAEAHVGGRFDARVLEPSPAAVSAPPWFADDPVNDSTVADLPVLAPVPVPDAAATWDEIARDDPDLASWCADRWLGAWRPLVVPRDLDALSATRSSWQTLAEHVVAAARYRSNGKIGLRYTRGGFGTPFYGADEQVRVASAGMLLVRGDDLSVHGLTTLQAAADAVGIAPGAPTEVYTPSTPLVPDASLDVDPASARFLGDWFGFGASVLEELRATVPPSDTPARVQLWPEHFDVSVDLGDEQAGRRATFGASPGDGAHPAPYIYVTPARPGSGSFWNEDAFASLGLGGFVDAPDQRRAALDYFAQARAELAR